MLRMWILVRIAVGGFAVMGGLAGCGLKTSGIATRPQGHVKEDAGPDAPGVDAPDAAIFTTVKRDGSVSPEPSQGVDCQGTEEQVNDCIINAPTKSGIPATRSKPTLTYQTCGAQ